MTHLKGSGCFVPAEKPFIVDSSGDRAMRCHVGQLSRAPPALSAGAGGLSLPPVCFSLAEGSKPHCRLTLEGRDTGEARGREPAPCPLGTDVDKAGTPPLPQALQRAALVPPLLGGAQRLCWGCVGLKPASPRSFHRCPIGAGEGEGRPAEQREWL